MPTLIDALVVSLGLDSTGFRTGSNRAREDLGRTKQEANQAAKEIEASGKKAAEFFTRLKNEALGLFAVFLGGKGLGSFVADTVSSVAALGRAATATGVAVDKLAGVGNAVEKYGGNAAAATQSYVALADAMQQAISMGDSSKVGAFQALGVNLGDKPDAILEKLAKFSETHSVGVTRLIAHQAGIDDGLITLALKGSAQARKDIEEGAKRSGINKEYVANVTALQSAWAEFSQTAVGIGNELFGAVAPALTAVLKVGKACLDWIKGFIEQHPKLTQVVVVLVTALTALISALTALAGLSLVIGGVGALTGLGGVLTGLASGLGTFAGALTALLAPLAAVALWWEALHISQGAGAAEVEAERRHTEERAREHPELVVPSAPKADPFKEWWRRNAPTFLGGGGAGGVAYQPGSILSDMKITAAQYDAFKSGVAGLEHARYDQMGGSSGRFAGRYQMGRAEIADTAGRLGVAVPTQQQFLADAAMQERFFEAYTAAHHRTMMAGSARYRSSSPAEQLAALGYAHNQGAGGAMRWLETGQVGRDAFNTPGTAYSSAVRRNLDPALLARARPAVSPQRMAQNDNSSETHIGAITIHTQATDARGIARSIDPAIRNRTAMVTQANSGLS